MAKPNAKTLLVDTNRAAYPLYQALTAQGHEVWVVGGQPSEPLAKLCTNYIQLDYSDEEQLQRLIAQQGFDYLIPGCTDLSYQVCANVGYGQFPGLENPDNTVTINRKSRFRKLAQRIGLPIPKVLTKKEACTADAVIVKPVDSFSGRGMTVLHRPNAVALEQVMALASQESASGVALIEEFVSGQLHSHSAFITNGRIVVDFIVQEDCIVSPFAVDLSRVVFNFSASMLESLRENIEKLASTLNLVDGLVHSQFIVSENRYHIIEITRRCPGDIYALLIELATSYPYGASYVAPFIGEQARTPVVDAAAYSHVIRHTASPKYKENLWGFHLSQPVHMRLFVPLATCGDGLAPGPLGRAGIFFFENSTMEEQEQLYQTILAGELYSFN